MGDRARPPADVLGLFQPPFAADPRPCFVRDARGAMVASCDSDGVIARGWGRIQYLPSPIDRYDAWCAWFRQHVPADADATETARVLNEAWAGPAEAVQP